MNTRNVIILTKSISKRPSLALENIRLIQESFHLMIKGQMAIAATRKADQLQTAMDRSGYSMYSTEVAFRYEGNNKDAAESKVSFR